MRGSILFELLICL